MGNFRGHALPGSAFLLFGLLAFLRSLDISFLGGFRSKRFWITFESFVLISSGGVGWFIELADTDLSNISMSHSDHLNILAMIFGLGVLEFFHLYGYLESPVWGLGVPIGFILIGLLFAAHPQESELGTTSHLISSFLLFISSLSKMVEVFLVHQFSKTENKIQKRNQTCRGNLFNIFCCNNPLNPMYTNVAIYSTLFPAFTAFMLSLTGVWWWQMGFSIFLYPYPEQMRTAHLAFKLLMQDFCGLVFCLAVISFLCEWVDRTFFPKVKVDSESDIELRSIKSETDMHG